MNKVNLISEWLKFSKDDYIVAKHLYEDIRPRQLNISAYHCAQCVEKALKAFLVSQDIDPPYTHDLDILRAKCSEINSDFDLYKNDCLDLTEYGTQTRYPGMQDILESDIAAAIEKADGIFEFVSQKALFPTEEDFHPEDDEAEFSSPELTMD
jgi:HEPN domain-containing protein